MASALHQLPPTLPWKAQNSAICPVLTLIFFQNIIWHLPKGSLPGSSGYTPVCPGSCPAFTLGVSPQQLPLAQPFNSKDCILHVSKFGKRRTVTFLAGTIMKVAFNYHLVFGNAGLTFVRSRWNLGLQLREPVLNDHPPRPLLRIKPL